jgi:hypothetical protein
MVRQADLCKPDDVTTVIVPKEDRFKFLIFGGFYLSVIRENPFFEVGQSPRSPRASSKGKIGDAVITLADSRDPDIRMFDKTTYKLVDFESNTVKNYQVPDDNAKVAKVKPMMGGLSKVLGSTIKIEKEQLFFVLNDVEYFVVKDSKGK